MAPGFAALGKVDTGLKLTANTAHACLIQMLNPTVRQIKNQREVLEAVLALVRDGSWNIDSQIVMRRTRCTSGFAAISQAAEQSIELRAGVKLPAVITDQDLPDLDLSLVSGRTGGGFLLTPFVKNSTPAFGGVVLVKRSLWHRLLPWRSAGGYLIDPNGNRFRPGKPPLELSAYAPKDRRYDPARSAMSLAEVSRLTVDDVFEEVTPMLGEEESGSLAEVGRSSGQTGLAAVRNFILPRSAVPSTLAAADEEDAPILLDASFEDGLVRFTLYDRGYGHYWLEVTLRRASPQPSVIAVRYQATDGATRELIIPVGGGTATSSSMADLPDYQPGTDGQAWLTAPYDGQTWPAETLRRSVLAAIGNGTARAWDGLAVLAPAEAGEVINQALRVLRGIE